MFIPQNTHGDLELLRGRRLHIKRSKAMSLAVVLLSVFVGGQVRSTADVKPDASVGGLKAKFIEVSGVKTRYYDAGEGEPMVMIHGGSMAGSSTANVFSRNIPGLAKRFHVFALDRRSSGMTRTPKDDKDYNYASEAEIVYQFIQTLELGPRHLA